MRKKKKFFYVPTVLVVEAKDKENAFLIAKNLTNSLLLLKPEELDGVIYTDDLDPSPASEDWYSMNQVSSERYIKEVPYEKRS